MNVLHSSQRIRNCETVGWQTWLRTNARKQMSCPFGQNVWILGWQDALARSIGRVFFCAVESEMWMCIYVVLCIPVHCSRIHWFSKSLSDEGSGNVWQSKLSISFDFFPKRWIYYYYYYYFYYCFLWLLLLLLLWFLLLLLVLLL